MSEPVNTLQDMAYQCLNLARDIEGATYTFGRQEDEVLHIFTGTDWREFIHVNLSHPDAEKHLVTAIKDLSVMLGIQKE